ncbi:MAG: FkbM family methyltransferase [Actinomycetes bacterium]
MSSGRKKFNGRLWLELLSPNAVARGRELSSGARRAGLDVGAAWLRPSVTRALHGSRVAYLPPAVLDASPTFVDIGANVGDWTAAVLHVLPTANVIVVEPTPANVAILRERFAGQRGVTVHDVAVSDRATTMTLHVAPNSVFNSLLPLRRETLQRYGMGARVSEVEVACRPLDDLLADVESVAVLKIDVQGAESAVLAGARDVLRRTAAILIETNYVSHYEGDQLLWDLHPQLRDAGFELYRNAFEYHDGAGRLLWADAVYARSDLLR